MRLHIFLLLTVTSCYVSGQQSNVYDYDDLGRLLFVTIGDLSIEYCYDLLGNRTCRIISGGNQTTVDLTPTDGMLSDQVSQGGQITGTYTSNNLGADNSGSFTTYFVLSLNGTYEPDQDILLRSIQSLGLIGGAMITTSVSVTIPETVAQGVYQLLIIQDPDGIITELSETNNILAWPITVQDCAAGFSANASGMPASCGQENGSASVSVSGGVAPLMYEWNSLPIQTTAVAAGLAAGNYTVSVTDAQGCLAVSTTSVGGGNEVPTANFGYSRDGLAVDFVNTSFGGASYSWQFGDGSGSSTENSAHTFGDVGSYEVCLTVGNVCGVDEACQIIIVSSVECGEVVNLTANWISEGEASISWEAGVEADSFRLNLFTLPGGILVKDTTVDIAPIVLSNLEEENYRLTVVSICNGQEFDEETTRLISTGEITRSSFLRNFYQSYNNGGWKLMGGAILENGNTISVSYRLANINIACSDENGELLWLKNTSLTTNISGEINVSSVSGGFEVLYRSQAWGMTLLKMNLSGDLICHKSIPAYGSNGVTHLDNTGNFITVRRNFSGNNGYFNMQKHDANGLFVWNRGIVCDRENYFIKDFITDADNNIYVYGGYWRSSYDPMVAKLDSNGVLLWHKIFSFDNGDYDVVQEIALSQDTIFFLSSMQGLGQPINRGTNFGKLSTVDGNPTEAFRYANDFVGETLSFYGDKLLFGGVSRGTAEGIVVYSDRKFLEMESYDTNQFGRINDVGGNHLDSTFSLVMANGGDRSIFAKMELADLLNCFDERNVDVEDEGFSTPGFSCTSYNIDWVLSSLTDRPYSCEEGDVEIQTICEDLCNLQVNTNLGDQTICQGSTVDFFGYTSEQANISWILADNDLLLGEGPVLTYFFAEAGVYNIKCVAFEGRCADSVLVEVIVEPEIQLQLDFVNETCQGSNGSVGIVNTADGDSFEWSTGATNSEITGLAAGVYSVAVTNFNGCTSIENFTIENIGTSFTAQTIVYDVSCAGANDGNIEVVPTGAMLPVTYEWSGGNSGFAGLMGVGAGSYAYTITDVNGCTYSSSVTVDEPEPMSVDSTVFYNTECETPYNGQITVEPQGGTPPFSYAWSGRNETTNSLIGLESYDGRVTITDANGCTYVSSYFLPVLSASCNTYYVDLDGDGYGDPDGVVLATSQPSGYVANGDDCDDDDANRYPTAPELCDGFDSNCNGMEDEPYVDACGECMPREEATPVIVEGSTSICYGEWTRLSLYDGDHYSARFTGGGTQDPITVPNNPSLQVTGDLTIEMWIKPTGFSGRQNPLVKAYGGEYTITVEPSRGVSFYNGGSGVNGQPYQGFSSTTGLLKANEWNHIAVVRDINVGTITFHINGVERNTRTMTVLPIATSDRDVVIGEGYAGGFGGGIDEVRIWNEALDGQTIKDWKNRRVTSSHPNFTGLVMNHDFEYGVDDVSYDKSGNGNHGYSIPSVNWSTDVPIIWNPDYAWSNGAEWNNIRINPSETTSYSITNSTATSGCVSEAVVNVQSVGISNLPTSANCTEGMPAAAEVLLVAESAIVDYDFGGQTGALNLQQQAGATLSATSHGMTPLTVTDELGCVTYGSTYAELANATIDLSASDPLCATDGLSASVGFGALVGTAVSNYQIGNLPVWSKKLNFTRLFNESFATEVGKQYLLVAGGKYTVWSGCDFLDSEERYFDPAYYFYNDTVPRGNFITGAFNGQRPLADRVSPNNTYAWFIEGNGQPLRFTYSDNNYADNCGHFDVQVWELTPMEVEWSTGDDNETITIDPVGSLSSLSVEVLENGTTVCEALVPVTVSPSPSYQLDIENEQCGMSDGSVTLTGYGDATVTWSDGTTGTAMSGLSSGDFGVTVTSPAGCSVEEQFSVENDMPTPAVIMPAPITVACTVMNDLFPFGLSEAIAQGPEAFGRVLDSLSGSTPEVVSACAGNEVAIDYFPNVDGCSVGTLIRRVEVTQTDGQTATGFQSIEIVALPGMSCDACDYGEIVLAEPGGSPGESVLYDVRLREGSSEATLKLNGQMIDQFTESSFGLELIRARPEVVYLSLEINDVEVDRKPVLIESCDWDVASFNEVTFQTEINDPCTAIKDGYAYLHPGTGTVSSPTVEKTYWTKVQDFTTPVNGITFDFRVRHHPSEGQLYQGNMSFIVYGEQGQVRFNLTDGGSQAFEHSVILPDGSLHPTGAGFYNPDLTGWVEGTLSFTGEGITVSQGFAEDNIPFSTAALGNLLGISMTFQGSGTIDYVKYQSEIGERYVQEFDDCNCYDRDDVSAPELVSVKTNRLRVVLPAALVAAPRVHEDLQVTGEFTGHHTGILQRDGNQLIFDNYRDYVVGEVLHVTLGDNVQLADGTTTEPFVWKVTVPPTQRTQGKFYISELGIELPANALNDVYALSYADVNRDELLDIVFAYTTSGASGLTVLVYEQQSDGSYAVPANYTSTALGGTLAGIPDLNNDQYPDLLVYYTDPSVVAVRLNNGNGTYGAEEVIPVSDYATGLAYGDLDADGDIDILCSSATRILNDNVYTKLMNDGNGNFSASITSTWIVAGSRHLNDLDGDGDLDLIYTSAADSNSVQRFRIYENNGSGGLTLVANQDNPMGRHVKQVVDVNSDGYPDLFLAGSTGDVILGDGSLGYQISNLTNLEPEHRNTILMDVNGDSLPDMLQTALFSGGSWAGPLRSRVRLPNGNYTTWTGNETVLQEALYSGDFDRDGDIDHLAVKVDRRVYLIENVDSVFHLSVTVGLTGPFDVATGLMSDALRRGGYLPEMDPYGIDCERIATGVLNIGGTQAIVDWMVVELRDGNNQLIARRSALLRRDGRVVDMDGVSPVRFDVIPGGDYAVVVRHRNHLAIQSRSTMAIGIGDTVLIDFMNPMVTPTINDQDQYDPGDGTRVMISGEANGDGQVNAVDRNNFWRLQNGGVYRYRSSSADFNLDGAVNAVDVNAHWRVNNSKVSGVAD